MPVDDRRELQVAAPVGGGALMEQAAADMTAHAGETPDSAVRSQWQLFLRRFFRHKLAVAAALVLLLLYLLAIFAPQIAPYELTPKLDAQTLLESRKGPTAKHWFGTDELGRDQLTRVLYAGRVSLAIGLSVAVMSTLLGTLIGAVAGYFGRWLDTLLMRLTDLFLIVPALAVLMIAQRGLKEKPLPLIGVRLSTTQVIVLILSLLFWQYIARIVRAQVLALKEKEFVEAARASGARSSRIILRHILPNCIGPIVVNATLAVAFAIVAESTLSFLGFGVQKPQTSWGNLLFDAKGNTQFDSHLLYFPGLFILLTVLCVNFVGDGLRDALDPQSGRD